MCRKVKSHSRASPGITSSVNVLTRVIDRPRNAAYSRPTCARLRVGGIRSTVRSPESPASASVTLSTPPVPTVGPVSVTTTSSAPGTADQRKSAGYSSARANVASTDESPRASSSGVTSGAPVTASGSAATAVRTAPAW